jgi:hypothetical protein
MIGLEMVRMQTIPASVFGLFPSTHATIRIKPTMPTGSIKNY